MFKSLQNTNTVYIKNVNLEIHICHPKHYHEQSNFKTCQQKIIQEITTLPLPQDFTSENRNIVSVIWGELM